MKIIVVGAGHNGLTCACYLVQAGHEVLVLEQSDKPGGGSRTDETVPGYRFDTHSAAHNIPPGARGGRALPERGGDGPGRRDRRCPGPGRGPRPARRRLS